jgi:acetyl esterase/lipase
MTDSDGAEGIHLPARTIPVPTGVSPEAQAMLRRPNPYAGRSEPAADDIAGWHAHIAAREPALLAIMAERARPWAPARQEVHRLSHCDLYEVEPVTLDPALEGKALLYVHGGAFTSGGGLAAAYVCHQIAHKTGIRTWSVDYRMPPAAPYPAGLDDTVEAWGFVADRHGAANVAATGPSAGAGLLASALLKARDLAMPLPAACVLHSPKVDLTESGDSVETNMGLDPVLRRLTSSIALYAGDHDLTHPYLSPLFGDFAAGFPPCLLTSGTRDLYLSNTVRLHRALRRAGIPADLAIWEAMGHGGFFGDTPEDAELTAEHAAFLRRHLA